MFQCFRPCFHPFIGTRTITSLLPVVSGTGTLRLEVPALEHPNYDLAEDAGQKKRLRRQIR